MSDEVEQEDRGMPCLVWVDTHGHHAFSWFPDAEEFTISMPIGWSMFADPKWGACLRNTFGRRAGPGDALEFAREGRDGFRIRKDAT